MAVNKAVKLCVWVSGTVACLIAPGLFAAPWIETGNNRSRHALQWLVDRGELNVPVTTWPVMWAGIAGQELGTSQEAAYLYMEARQTLMRGGEVRMGLFAGNAPQVFRGYGASPQEDTTAELEAEMVGSRFAAGITAVWTPAPEFDDKEARFDGSYLAANLGNWVGGAGMIDRWWGPGWQSSLLLSNNARPVPSAWLSRKDPKAFDTPWLSWIGPWQFVAFAGQLEEERTIPNAKLLGARLSFRPVKGLELGLSRTAQWGGDGRSESFDSFVDLVAGKDNRGSSGISEENEPGNQLGSIDLRYGFGIGQETIALYAQGMGEDEAGGLPSRWVMLAGLEWTTGLLQGRQRWFIEGSETTSEETGDDGRPNYTYEHNIYNTGYRYRGRSLAVSPGNDTQMLTLGLFHYFPNGHELELTISDIGQNQDGTVRGNITFPGTNSRIDRPNFNRRFAYGTFAYRFPVGKGSRLSLQGWISGGDKLPTADDDSDKFGVLAGWEYRF